MKRNNLFLLAHATSLLFLSVLLVSLNRPLAAEKLRLASPIKGTAHNEIPILAALEKAFWKEEGLEVEWTPFHTGLAMDQALAAAAVDTGVSMATSIVILAARGIPVFIVADTKLRNDFFIYVAADSPIKRPQDLRGAKVGISALFTVAHAYGLAAAKELDLEKSIKWVGVGGIPAAVAALKAGAVDAILQTYFGVAPLKYRGEVRELITLREYLPKIWLDTVMLARGDVAAKKPKALSSLIKGYFRGAEFSLAHPEWAMEKLRTVYGFSRDEASRIYAALNYGRDPRIDRTAVENMVAFLIRYGIIPREKAPAPDLLYTNQFADEAKR